MTASPTEPPPNGLGARLRANPLAVDAFIAIGLTAVSLITIVGGARDLGSYDPLSLVLLVLTTLPLIARRRWPLAVFAICYGATFAHAALAREALSTTLGFLIALYTVGEYRDRRVSGLAAIVTAVSVGTLIAVRAPLPAGLSGLVQTELAILAAWVLGTWARDRRRQVETAEVRAGRLEDEREELDRRAVAEERERIARELHDVVTHHVSVIVIQAGRRRAGARPAAGGRPRGDQGDRLRPPGRRSPTCAGCSGSSAGRQRGGAGGREGDLAPMPGLDRLGELLEQVRSAGMPVELSVTGERRALDPGIELSAYRIIQEALTNALKHAPGARTRVAVGYGRDGARDPGRRRGPIGGGRCDHRRDEDRGLGTRADRDARTRCGVRRGVRGVRHRAGFRVKASLPLAGDPAS